MEITQAVEDYLKTLYKLEVQGLKATTSEISARMEVSSASVTNMIKRLAQSELVSYKSYRGAELTDKGRAKALKTIRNHRLLEVFLHDVLAYSWDEVHEEAERLEHHISEKFVQKISELLNHPSFDPHGDPIPNSDGKMPIVPEYNNLLQVELNESLYVARVTRQQTDLLQYLESLNLMPGTKVKVLERAPFKGPLKLKVENEECSISAEMAEHIYVTNIKRN